MDDLIAGIVCGGGLLGLVGLLGLAVWESAHKGNRDRYKALQSQCGELHWALYTVKDDRERLARRVCELERYLVPYAKLMQQLDARDRQRVALQRENRDLKQRLDGARVLVLALASKAGVRVDGDPVSGWRVV